MARVCVIGAGPAGCVFAARMSQFGHTVTLIERQSFPRSRLGESLSPGVLPLLEVVGARQAIEDARFLRVNGVTTTWDGSAVERRDPQQRGLIVDRGLFDALLLEHARALGVHVLQPATVTALKQHGTPGNRGADLVRSAEAWNVSVRCDTSREDLHADFVADATGRVGVLPSRRDRLPIGTVALYGYWQGTGLPGQPSIHAAPDAWHWGVPLPDGRYNTLIFLDAATVRAQKGRPLEPLLREHIARSGMLDGSEDAELVTPVRAIDATPFVDEASVTTSSIKIGDAALAIDPLSSSGVQKAIQTALAGAVVANTLLRRSGSGEAAMRFYRASVGEAAVRHRGWAAAQYARAARRGLGAFWDARAVDAVAEEDPPETQISAAAFVHTAVELSAQLDFVDLPCIEGEFVTEKAAVRHPALAEPVAFVGAWELCPLLRHVTPGMTPLDIARAWADRVPLRSGMAIVKWLLDHRLLVPGAYTRLDGRRTP